VQAIAGRYGSIASNPQILRDTVEEPVARMRRALSPKVHIFETANKPGPHRRPAAKHDAAPETFPDPPSTLIAPVRGRKTRVLFASRMGIWNPAGRGPSCGEWRALLSVSSWCVVRLYGPGKACMRRPEGPSTFRAGPPPSGRFVMENLSPRLSSVNLRTHLSRLRPSHLVWQLPTRTWGKNKLMTSRRATSDLVASLRGFGHSPLGRVRGKLPQ
jgi:hypothetical protein